MKKLMTLAVALCTYHTVLLADHDHQQLQQLSAQLVTQASDLYQDARVVIGSFPSYRQRYAYEHISFFHTSAHRFYDLVSGALNDHQPGQIQYAYQQLRHNIYWARATFNDLFYGVNAEDSDPDHVSYAELNRVLTSCESLVYQIGSILPVQE